MLVDQLRSTNKDRLVIPVIDILTRAQLTEIEWALGCYFGLVPAR